MKLTINGEPQLSSAETLGALVEHLGMKPDRVAIELNREIVPREQWPQTPLHDGDRLEIVHFVGGGSESSPCMNCHPPHELPSSTRIVIPPYELSSRAERGICSSPQQAH
jgi:thiamine biosynthesis protein ThiS